MKKILLTTIIILASLGSLVYAAGVKEMPEPDPVFSTNKVFPTTWSTGDHPKVLFAGDKMYFFGGLRDVAMAYKKKTGVDVALHAFGCKGGADMLIAGKATLAGQCRIQSAPFEKKAKLKKHLVARYGLVAFVNKSNPVKNLTLEQLDKINKGKITNWKEVGGADAPIIVVEPTHCSCKHPGKFEHQKGPEILRTVENGDLKAGLGKFTVNRVKAYSQFITVELVNKLPNAIGSEKSPFADPEKVKLISINGVFPSDENIFNGSYPVVRVMRLLTGPGVNQETLDFLQFVKSKEGQDILHAGDLVRHYQ